MIMGNGVTKLLHLNNLYAKNIFYLTTNQIFIQYYYSKYNEIK